MKLIFRYIFLFTTCFPAFYLGAQPSETERPRLVVGIMIDGLQQKHLDMLWNYFDANGFKKIAGQGATLRNMYYNTISAGTASDIATVMTGTTPFYNGVAGNFYYNRATDKITSVLQDENQIGIGTKLTYSAHNLVSSTITDELMMAYPERSKCYAVAIQPEAAIMMGGHTAKSACWMDDVFMKWITTGYYSDGLSRWADEMNVNSTFNTLVNRDWQPLYSIQTYITVPVSGKKQPFLYNPTDKRSKNSSVSILKTTPAANTLVTELGLKIISEEQLGKDIYPDMMMLQYTVRTPNEKVFSLTTPEKEDMYLRLDKELQYLLQKIDNQVGLDKTLFFVFGNQINTHSPTELGENKIPAGYFNANRSMALLNTYLMALYGQEPWIVGYYGKNIFLNREKIEAKKINYHDIQQRVADFMIEFEGVQAAYPATEAFRLGANADPNSEMARLRNSINRSSVGDVVISLLPGWLEMDDNLIPVGESNSISSYVPVFFYGWQIKPRNIVSAHQVIDIAPTLSRILDIPMTNACIGKPVEELVK